MKPRESNAGRYLSISALAFGLAFGTGCEADDSQKECSSSEAVYNYCSDYQGKYKCTGNEQCKCYESKDDPCECGCEHYGPVKEGWEGTK